MRKIYSLFLLLFLAPALVVAEEKSAAKGEWKGEGALGYTSTSGNTESSSLNASLGLSRESMKWKHEVKLEALKTKSVNSDTDEEEVTADSIQFKQKSRYKFADKTYVFESIRYEEDKFSGFDYQEAVTLGVGHQFIDTDAHKLDAALGAGYREQKITETEEIVDDNILTLDAGYKYTISKSASFTEDLLVETGEENTHSESVTALNTKINSSLASKIAYTVKNNSDVPDDVEKTDTILSVSLVYSF